MEELLGVILCISATFTIAFGLAWIVSLASACNADSQPTKTDTSADDLLNLLDLLMLLLDRIPIFALIRAILDAPAACRAVRKVWQSDASIRNMFWCFAVSLVITIAALNVPR